MTEIIQANVDEHEALLTLPKNQRHTGVTLNSK